jgi:alcohol dehydrogenase
VHEFLFPRLERVVSGAGTIDLLASELERRQLSRAIVVTGRTLGASALLARITKPLGGRCVFVFTEARQHVPSSSVTELARAIDHHHADSVISFGGGSPIDTVKAAIHSLMTTGGPWPSDDDGPTHIAIPTTLSAGEFTAVVGITDEDTRVKPTVTLDTPAWLWAASGVRALDHAVETMYSPRHHPMGDALASRGLSLMLQHLPASLSAADADRLEHRLQCQIAAWLSVFGLPNAGLGLSHALGHQIGPRWNVPHGVTSCITLPHAMRLMAAIAPERFGSIARAFDIAFDEERPGQAALESADRMALFISRLELPQRLRDVHVPHEDVREVAGLVHDILHSAAISERVISRAQVEALLAGAY